MLACVASFAAGTARGMFTLLQATAVTDRWGTVGYGARSSVLSGGVMAAAAFAPWAGAVLAARTGSYAWAFVWLGVAAAVSAALVRPVRSRPDEEARPRTGASSTPPGRRRRHHRDQLDAEGGVLRHPGQERVDVGQRVAGEDHRLLDLGVVAARRRRSAAGARRACGPRPPGPRRRGCRRRRTARRAAASSAPRSPDQDRRARLLHGRGHADRLGELVVLPSNGPSSSLHICRQICSVSSSRSNRSAVGGNGTPRPRCSRSYHAAPMPEHRPAAREHVEGRHRLGQQARVAVRRAGHQRAQPDALGEGGEVAERRVALEHRLGRAAEVLHLEPVVHDGEHRDAALVGDPRGLRQPGDELVGPSGVAEVRVVDAESHGATVAPRPLLPGSLNLFPRPRLPP